MTWVDGLALGIVTVVGHLNPTAPPMRIEQGSGPANHAWCVESGSLAFGEAYSAPMEGSWPA